MITIMISTVSTIGTYPMLDTNTIHKKRPSTLNRPLNVRPKILTLRRSVFLWQNIALYLN